MDTDNIANFRGMMGFNAGNEVMYEDDAADTSIPDIQKVTKRNNVLPLWGNQTTMNLNTLVLENIVQSSYYKNYLSEITTYQGLIDEIYYNVKHLEPWERGTRRTTGMTGMFQVRGVGAGGVISTAFCCLYKMFSFRVTRKQLVSLINSTQSTFLRGMGFMYIRYTQPPADLWAWFEAYLDDDEEIDPRAGGGDKMPISQMLRQMLTKLDWFGTLFPRIPVPIQKQLETNFRERSKASYLEDMERDRDRHRSRSRSPRERRRSGSREGPSREPRERDAVERDRKRPGHHYKCHHHLRHHHCRKHKTKCPSKAVKARQERQAAAQDAPSDEQKHE
ncbi:PRP38 family protein [Aphelenchoides avenae]|nr:PRP38 family protein [Aphelenchus avenae]